MIPRRAATASIPCLAVAVLWACGATAPSPSTPAVAASGDAIPQHDTFTIESRALGETRMIHVHRPRAAAAAAATADVALPVLYMPDGGIDEDFPHVVIAVEALIEQRAIRPVIVVGIPNTERRRDLTPPTQVESDREIAPRVGGSAAFRRFVREELVPEIERRYRTTGERSIVGESLAGLFVVETFLEDPTLFTHSVAFDPSLWWDAGRLVDRAEGKLRAFDSAPRSLWFAGSVDRAPEVDRLAETLARAAPPTMRWRFAPRPDVTHATIFRALELEALADALR